LSADLSNRAINGMSQSRSLAPPDHSRYGLPQDVAANTKLGK
jgi:hypothetical protein